MPTQNHPASVRKISNALGLCETVGSRKVKAAEDIFDLILQSPEKLASSKRPDRLQTAFVGPMRTIAKLARNLPEDDFEIWIKNYWREYQTRKHLQQRGNDE